MKKPSPMPVEPKADKTAAAAPKTAKAASGKKYNPSHHLGEWLHPKGGKKKK